MISKKAVGTKINSTIVISARLLTSIIFFFCFTITRDLIP
ncbi:photosystem II protein M [Iris pallida]|uniref:Photosystem II protein M (Plastid) n=1 Tax=Iris pallida TaxID=29817 RepID=A0AAX6ES03_IRIPA|nr:photosystem II protein M [Iris pallida]